MTDEYFGAPLAARRAVEDLLGIPATGREQDWETEFADSSRIDEMIAAYSTSNLDLESRSALGLLLLCSMCDAESEGLLAAKQIDAVELLLAADVEVRERMRFYWFEALPYDNPPFLARLTGS